MDTTEIIVKLEACRLGQESTSSRDIKETAISMLSCTSDIRQLLHDLLTRVVKPLFSKQQHPDLTATGRKKLVPDTPVAGRLSDTIDWDDESKTWKNGWTTDLLMFCLSQYPNLPSTQEKCTFESQFHLLVPPILNLVDDGNLHYKSQGCTLLRLLCEEVTQCQSDILRRTGMSEVFSDALRTNFMYLPTLTPEDESMKLLSELYPAFRSLVTARFPGAKRPELPKKGEGTVLSLRPATMTAPATSLAKSSTTRSPTSSLVTESKVDTREKDARESLLDLVLRQGILASYAHATDYVHITTVLLHEASVIFSMMGIYSAKYLQSTFPLLRNVLCNPFGTAYLPLLLSALECLEMLIQVCWPRIRDKWWGECLRSIVGCWMQIEDDEHERDVKSEKVEAFDDVKDRLQGTCRLLVDIVGGDFDVARKRLEQEDERLKNLFSTAKDGVS